MKKIDYTQNWAFYKKGEDTKRVVSLPHDAMMHEVRRQDCASGSAGGFFPGGIYCYEKKIENVKELIDKHVEILFDGVYKDAKVYLNEELLCGHAYGYTPFTVLLDGKLEMDRENILRVEVDNSQIPNSRWYTGSGIYRPVSLYVSDRAHIMQNGIRIQTTDIQPPRIQILVEHTGDEVEISIKDGERILKKAAGSQVEVELPEAELWDEEHPKLYTCHVVLKKNGIKSDEADEIFGIRKLTWNSKGFYVNGKGTLLRGACVHHDNGILGACSYDVSEERRVRKLKEAGYNAVRSSHNPASPGMLEACDRLGMYVIDETWDMWYNKKSAYDYSRDFQENYQEDIRAMVERDYNHPSVVMYSIGNEVSEPARERGVELAREMVSLIHEMDSTRAVTGGINLMILSKSAKGNDIYKEDGGIDESNAKKTENMSSTMFNMMTSMVGTGMNKGANSKKADKITTPVLDCLDIAGYNYASGRYPLEGKAHPDRIIYGSETFPQDIVKNWRMVETYPYLIGDFMWTGWDYLGEAGIGTWAYTKDGKGFNKPYPWLLADAGAIDILGNPNGELFLAQAVWGKLKKPMIAVQPVNHPGVNPAKAVWRGTNAIPSWSWQGCEGNKAVIEVYGKGEKAELTLNGKSLERKRMKDYKAIFKTKYQPGVLEAILYDEDGTETGRNSLSSAKSELTMALCPENQELFCREPIYVNLNIQDQDGNIECNADQKIKVSVTGGKLLAYGSANPRTEESFVTGEYTTYYGRGQVIVMREDPGKIEIAAQCPKYGRVKQVVDVKKGR